MVDDGWPTEEQELPLRTRRPTPPNQTATSTTTGIDLSNDEIEDHDRGLAFDIETLVGRRRALGWFAAGGLGVALAACGSSDKNGSVSSSSTSSAVSAVTASGVSSVPAETGGPYPADGTNGPDVLTESGVVRQDITTSFGSYSGTADGVAMTIKLKLIDVGAGGAPLAGGALYLWHCSAEGGYSLYSPGVVDQNYLRGVQEADGDGTLSFTSIWPACYDGRWPHIHFEVWSSLDEAVSGGQKLRTSQIALPEEACKEVYATSPYEASTANLARVSLDTDMVFSDGYASQVPTWEGNVDDGYTITMNVGI